MTKPGMISGLESMNEDRQLVPRQIFRVTMTMGAAAADAGRASVRIVGARGLTPTQRPSSGDPGHERPTDVHRASEIASIFGL